MRLSPRACSRPEQGGGPPRRENLQRSGREEAGLPAGEIFSPRRLRVASAGSKAERDKQGTGLRQPGQGTEWRIAGAPVASFDGRSRDQRFLVSQYGTADRWRGRSDDKIRIWSESWHCGSRRRQCCEGARPPVTRNSCRGNSEQRAHVTAEIEERWWGDEQVGTETDARQPARFIAAEIFAASRNLSVLAGLNSARGCRRAPGSSRTVKGGKGESAG